jgi:hypothetical protein
MTSKKESTAVQDSGDKGMIAKTAPPAVVVGEHGLQITTVDELTRVGDMIVKSGFAPKGMDTVPAVCAAIQMGLELGIGPMAAVQNIAVINGRPAAFGDLPKALVESSGLCEAFAESFEGEEGKDSFTAVCTVKRWNRAAPVQQKFSISDAKTAKLWGKAGPWTEYPRRMLQWRARGFAIRDLFPDVLKGLAIGEEARDAIDVTPTETTPAPRSLSELEARMDDDAVDPDTGEITGPYTDDNPPAEEMPEDLPGT